MMDPATELFQEVGITCGLDEVGRGPLAGPVVAACVVLDETRPIPGLDDSKKLTAKKREELSQYIFGEARAVGIGVVEPDQIDQLNILRASLYAMELAFEQCERNLGERIFGAVVDGNQTAPLPGRVTQRTVVGGDGQSLPIMAASIVAKVFRDERMVVEAERYPMYGFERHKGYGTAFHLAALDQHGPCPLHRRSFAPVAQAALRLF